MDDSRVPITITLASLIFCKVPPGFSCPSARFENRQRNNADIAGIADNAGNAQKRFDSLRWILGLTDERVRSVLKNKGQCSFMGRKRE